MCAREMQTDADRTKHSCCGLHSYGTANTNKAIDLLVEETLRFVGNLHACFVADAAAIFGMLGLLLRAWGYVAQEACVGVCSTREKRRKARRQRREGERARESERARERASEREREKEREIEDCTRQKNTHTHTHTYTHLCGQVGIATRGVLAGAYKASRRPHISDTDTRCFEQDTR